MVDQGGQKTPPTPLIVAGPGKARILSPQELALYEAGKKIIADSVTTGIDFCKTMIGIATGAVAVYFALFTYILDDDYQPSAWEGVLILLPPLQFLIAAGFFARGYSPKTENIHLNTLLKPIQGADGTSVEEVRDKMISHRSNNAFWGMVAFLLGILTASIVVVTLAMTRESDVEPAAQNAIVVNAASEPRCGNLTAGTEPGQLLFAPLQNKTPTAAETVEAGSSVTLVDACP